MRIEFHKIRRYFHNGASYVLGLERVYGGPAHVHIEITNICNFRCIYCPQSMHEEHVSFLPPGKMALETFERILDRVSERFRLEWVILTRDGEPLVHPGLEEFVAHVTSRGLKSSLGSNGSLITTDRARSLIANGLGQMRGDFCFDREEYERLRAGADHEEALAGYRNILQAARERDADFTLGLIDLGAYRLRGRYEARESVAQLASLFEGYERWLEIGPAVMHNALGESKETLSTSKQSLPADNKNYNLCHHPWVELVIDYLGNAVACCRDLRSEYRLGNVLEAADVDRDIWNGEKMRYLRRSLLQKDPARINVCGKCDLPHGTSYAGNTIRGKVFKFITK
jgi:radical SAM protein with 4Fe4S-binding SPASM domain